MSITMDHRLVAHRPSPTPAAPPARPVRPMTPQWLEFAGFFLAFLVLNGLAMAMRFYVYGPDGVWSRLCQIFG
ncbi:MAG: hypothetical protein J0H82_13845 [Alphaproteobacteria bacterium]|jgi:hypothetical protein|nr:hypothetical protein [Alphaproteobacteria bacterium]